MSFRLTRAIGQMKWFCSWAGGLRIFVWLYLVLVLVVWLLLGFAGDRWWLATVMLFGPRWVYGLPLVLLVPAAAIWRRRLLWPLAASAMMVVGPIMGLCLPWSRLAAPHGPTLRVLTCNVKGRSYDNEALNELIRTAAPDIVALQDCGAVRVAWPEGWHVCQHNELLVASRYPVREDRFLVGRRIGHVWPRPNMIYCIVELPQREIAFCCVHLPSPHYGLAAVLDRRTLLSPRRSGLLADEISERRQQAREAAERAGEISEPLVLAGDFNMPTDSTIYRQTWARFRNAFSQCGFGFGNTMRPNVYGGKFGMRIDHILTGPEWRPCRCWVGPDVGSEHLPLIADLVWAPAENAN